eukprot:CAMPEP_0174825730 /NCGR_PEP_ID=MMETSP1107-20130205/43056_1 /TAXON_ID=36770 /ORGANISM="Paraphysomonas vestita, Strain GFlagA" /LENGTH=203 /DNA_ID=CAMNT_0016057641 /DNA_START=819 /DNA_END=1430 /DNA_ORIENTATION=+
MYIPTDLSSGSSGPSFASIIAAGKDMGTQILANQNSTRNKNSNGLSSTRGSNGSNSFTLPNDMKSTAKAELNLLADLLGMSNSSSSKELESDAKPFKINLFPDNTFDDRFDGKKTSSSGSKGSSDGNSGGSSGYILIDIDGTCGAKTFDEYLNDLKLRDDDETDEKGSRRRGGDDKHGNKNDGDDEDDLLSLMDSTAAKSSRK